jgi:hypothetical protein
MPITPENAVLSAGKTVADLKQVKDFGEFVYVMGAEAKHPDLVVQAKNEDIAKVITELTNTPVARLRREFMVVSKNINIPMVITDRLKQEGGRPWSNFCDDLVNYFCYRAVLFKRPIPVLNQKQYEDLINRRGVWLDGTKPKGYDAEGKLRIIFDLVNNKDFLAEFITITTIPAETKATILRCAEAVKQLFPEGITMSQLEQVIAEAPDVEERLPPEEVAEIKAKTKAEVKDLTKAMALPTDADWAEEFRKADEEDDRTLPPCGECGKKPSEAKERFNMGIFTDEWICEACNEPYRIARLKREAEDKAGLGMD